MPSNSFTNVYSADLLSRRFTGGELQKVNRLPTQTNPYDISYAAPSRWPIKHGIFRQ